MTTRRSFFIFTLVLCATTRLLGVHSMPGHYTYIFKIHTPPLLNHEDHRSIPQKSLHGWRVLYKGESLVFHGDLTKIIERNFTFSLSLIITPEVRCVQPTILSGLLHLELIPNCPVRWYNLKLTFEDGVWRWLIEEVSAGKVPKWIPPHALIFLFDPQFVQELRQPPKAVYSLDAAHETGNRTFEMPSIILEGSAQDIYAASIQAQHALLSVRSYHGTSPCAVRVIDGIYCALDLP
jgi:hypothetical protein